MVVVLFFAGAFFAVVFLVAVCLVAVFFVVAFFCVVCLGAVFFCTGSAGTGSAGAGSAAGTARSAAADPAEQRSKVVNIQATAQLQVVLVKPEVYSDAKQIADHLIANGVMVQKWIPVTERMPEPYIDVLTLRAPLNGGTPFYRIDCLSQFNGSLAWVFDSATWKSKVTHWMPLPELPKEE